MVEKLVRQTAQQNLKSVAGQQARGTSQPPYDWCKDSRGNTRLHRASIPRPPFRAKSQKQQALLSR
jgi:hypothetical protein